MKNSKKTKVAERSFKEAEENKELEKDVANLKRQLNEAIKQMEKSDILAIEEYKKSQSWEA